MGTTAVKGDSQAREFGIPQKMLIVHDVSTNLDKDQREPFNIPEIANYQLLPSYSSSSKGVEQAPKRILIGKSHNLEIPDTLPTKKTVMHISKMDMELNDILFENNENIEIEEIEEGSNSSIIIEHRDDIGTTFTDTTKNKPKPNKTSSYKNKQRALQETIEHMNNSTLDVLRNINKNIENISTDIKRIGGAIAKISDKLFLQKKFLLRF